MAEALAGQAMGRYVCWATALRSSRHQGITFACGTVTAMSNEATVLPRRRARLTNQGQITVPKAVREALDIRPGDEIEFVPRGDDFIVAVRPRRSVLEFAAIGSAAAARVPASAEELDALVAEGMARAAVGRIGPSTDRAGRSTARAGRSTDRAGRR
jgi:antitoxin PrlF